MNTMTKTEINASIKDYKEKLQEIKSKYPKDFADASLLNPKYSYNYDYSQYLKEVYNIQSKIDTLTHYYLKNLGQIIYIGTQRTLIADV